MKKIIVFDGAIIGATMDDSYPADLVDAPQGFVPSELSDYDLVDGAVVLNVERNMVRRRGLRVAELNQAYGEAIATLRSDYPEAETMTWTLQVAEAKTHQAWVDAGKDGTAPATPFVTALSTARDAVGVGDGFEDLVSRILANDAAYTPAVAGVTAKRHAAELEIKTAPNAEALAAVMWEFLP